MVEEHIQMYYASSWCILGTDALAASSAWWCGMQTLAKVLHWSYPPPLCPSENRFSQFIATKGQCVLSHRHALHPMGVAALQEPRRLWLVGGEGDASMLLRGPITRYDAQQLSWLNISILTLEEPCWLEGIDFMALHMEVCWRCMNSV